MIRMAARGPVCELDDSPGHGRAPPQPLCAVLAIDLVRCCCRLWPLCDRHRSQQRGGGGPPSEQSGGMANQTQTPPDMGMDAHSDHASGHAGMNVECDGSSIPSGGGTWKVGSPVLRLKVAPSASLRVPIRARGCERKPWRPLAGMHGINECSRTPHCIMCVRAGFRAAASTQCTARRPLERPPAAAICASTSLHLAPLLLTGRSSTEASHRNIVGCFPPSLQGHVLPGILFVIWGTWMLYNASVGAGHRAATWRRM